MAKRVRPPVRVGRRRGPTLIQRSRSVAPSEKAAFHQVLGAGRSRVKRQFLGLTGNDEDAIRELVRRGLQKAVKDFTR